VAEGLVREPSDFWHLRQEDIAEMERLGEKSAENLVNAIHEKKEIELPRFLSALGIPNVGWETAHALADNFHSLERIMNASLEEFQAVPDIGPVVAESIYDFFNTAKAKEEIKNLFGVGLRVKSYRPAIKAGKLAGKSVVITGTLEAISREEAKEKIESAGGKWSDTVSSKTDYLVVGDEPGSKLDKAKKLGVAILEENEFLELI